jgi:hypothetical protein
MGAREDAERILAEVPELDPGNPLGVVTRNNYVSVLTEHEMKLREVLRALLAETEPEWEYGWAADEAKRANLSPRGPHILLDHVPYAPEQIAAFPRGKRIRRRKAGPWEEVPE